MSCSTSPALRRARWLSITSRTLRSPESPICRGYPLTSRPNRLRLEERLTGKPPTMESARTGKPHDAVVIGAGHNGLVAANLLADRGWSVLVLESEEWP